MAKCGRKSSKSVAKKRIESMLKAAEKKKNSLIKRVKSLEAAQNKLLNKAYDFGSRAYNLREKLEPLFTKIDRLVAERDLLQ